MTQKLSNFIGGDFVAPMSTDYFESYNPATGELDRLVPDSSTGDIGRAVQHAKVAFPYWSKCGAESRSRVLNRIADLIDKNKLDLAGAESRDQGKPLRQVLEVDLPRVIQNFRYFADAILHVAGTTNSQRSGLQSYTTRQAFGIAGLISSWNQPLDLLTRKMAPAIAAGCTVVCKPSEHTSLSAWMLGNLLNDAGVPEGVVNIVFGRGETVGQALVEHPHVHALSFVGTAAVGQKIAETAAPLLKRLSLELGGKNPILVFADADLEEASQACVSASFFNQGEMGWGGSCLYVEEPIFDSFVKMVAEKTKALKVGDPQSSETQLGPLASRAHRDQFLSLVEAAKSEGAKFHAGETQTHSTSGGYFVQPVVLSGVSPESSINHDELVGPLVTVAPFLSDKDAVYFANASRYGTSATLWTKDAVRIQQLSEQLQAGTVLVNREAPQDIQGTLKASGVSREGSFQSLEFFSDIKNVYIKS